MRSHDTPNRGRIRSDDEETDAAAPPQGSTRLEMTVVEYPGRPDRCTVYPAGLTGIERMETWLSVNRDVCVDLDAWR